MKKNRLRAFGVAIFAAPVLALSACGGGGGPEPASALDEAQAIAVSLSNKYENADLQDMGAFAEDGRQAAEDFANLTDPSFPACLNRAFKEASRAMNGAATVAQVAFEGRLFEAAALAETVEMPDFTEAEIAACEDEIDHG